MIEQHGTHICKNCGEEIAWSVFIRIEYAEQEKTMTANCPNCGKTQKWTQKIKVNVA